ncbi:hypothetical protein PACTADRAFT_57369 [Pachysolen tannophilus NRRL Y-2460]|uniref:Zn(2)-C6 fungal-type domain-containing protein n=1 Tax=Pachysolen tannophilus NRRL Y-2460 TaxID=669874 RepID=A0A1E4TXA6_PACTA|nr:hypothetical protein PACTADRAFT_57369 [Pachysolen tannophilus NRRL Y-2460]
MFSTFEAKDLDKLIDCKKLPYIVSHSQNHFSQQIIKGESFVGSTSRSRFGCLSCRKKKKRCDEKKPICSRCSRTNNECHWKPPGTERKNNVTRRNFENSKHEIIRHSQILSNSEFPTPTTSFYLKASANTLHEDNGNFSLDSKSMNSHYSEFRYISNDEFHDNGHRINSIFHQESMKLYMNPSYSLFQNLNQEALLYLDHYKTCVATTVSVAPDESNYFLKYYLPLAEIDKSVLYGIIGWGGMFLSGSKDNSGFKYYMQKSIESTELKISHGLDKLNKMDILSMLTSLTIHCAAEICIGDVKEWFIHFKKIYDIILQKYGDLTKLLLEFDNCNEVRWLVSNFLYHDVLTNVGVKKGTFFSHSEYQLALKNNDSAGIMDTDYGSDPLQGCVKPLYMIIGEIVNASVDLKEEDLQLTKLEKQVQRLNHSQKIQAVFTSLESKILNSKPNAVALLYLKTDQELELNLTLFELYQLTARLYLHMLILKTPANNPQVQQIVFNLNTSLDILIGSKLQTTLCLPFLIGGLNCVSEIDRLVMSKRLQKLTTTFPVKNLVRVWEVLNKSWELNKDGSQCINWIQITDELDWDLCAA